jgi:hypothetical protein
MPERYEAIRDKFQQQQGMSAKEAKKHAAMIYQSTRKKGEPELNKAVAEEKKKKE